MKRFKPGAPMIVVLLVAVVFGGALWLVQRERRQTDRILSALRDRAAERERLLNHSPALTLETEQAAAAEVAGARQILAGLRATLPNPETDRLVAPPPARSVDAFFALAAFVESTRASVSEAGIGVDPREGFGFSTYVNAGPAAALLPVVHQQRLLVQQLVRILVAAQPREFLGIRREQPGGASSMDQNAAGDFFTFDPALRLRQPGQLETAAFRLEFSGPTATLRDFLLRLAADARPFVVRSVEVEPLVPADSPPSPAKSTAVPLVRPHLSKFAVIVECVSLPPTS